MGSSFNRLIGILVLFLFFPNWTVADHTTLVNQPPVLDPIGDREVRGGSTLAIILSGSDLETPDDDLRFSVSFGQAGEGFDKSTNLFTYEPTCEYSWTWFSNFFVLD